MEKDEYRYYLSQLNEQATLLIDLCHAYDNGSFIHAKLISNIIRTIVKDVENPRPSTRTKSLLNLLDRKDTMKFYNTGYEAIDPIININLVGIVNVPSKIPTNSSQTENYYLPLLDYSSQIDVKWLSFDAWWKSKIIVYKSESINLEFTRKSIVLTMAEQDGGTHVDSVNDIEMNYFELATATKSLFNNVDKNGIEAPIINLHYALVRQIAHELIISLFREFKFNLEYKPTNKYNLRGVHESNLKQFGVFAKEKLGESVRTKTPHKELPKTSFKTPENAAFVKIHF